MKTLKQWKAAGALLLGVGAALYSADARTDDAAAKKASDQIARSSTLFDVQNNAVSNIQFTTTNYGIFGYDPRLGVGAGYWPRGSSNQYIFAGGVWFGALKKVAAKTQEGNDTTVINKLCAISYNPNSGVSWFVPGKVEDGDAILDDAESIKKYRTYFSTDFDMATGVPIVEDDGPNWPIWDTEIDEVLKEQRYTGNWVDDPLERDTANYSKGPAAISQEDIVCVYKDTDVSYYEDGEELAAQAGYPLQLDFEQRIYSWGFGKYQQFLFMMYNITNRSNDTLAECWLAPAYDFDLATRQNSRAGASNDRTRFYEEDPSLNLAYQWTEDGEGEAGQGFGYIGIDFLESPAVDAEGFLRTDQKTYSVEEQLGLKTFKNWVIEIDPQTNSQRYDFVSANVRDPDDENAGDKRFLVATGPFNLRPGETSRVVVGMVFASPSSEEGRLNVPTGTEEDVQNLVNISEFAQSVYDDNYKAPIPPDPVKVEWTPMNNAVKIAWDLTSENSHDEVEAGLDFVGYRIYRSRNPNLDSFDVDVRSASPEFNDKGRGPFGWKQIAAFEMPRPFLPSSTVAPEPGSITSNNQAYVPIDSMVLQSFNSSNYTYTVDRLLAASWNDFWNTLSQAQIQSLARNTIVIDPALVADKFEEEPQGDIPSLMKYIQAGCVAESNFPNLNTLDSAGVLAFTHKVMDSLTGGRTFIDFGDDNGDGVILTTNDLATTEKLINNVEYYYRVLAYDEGDYLEGTPGKLNTTFEGRNMVKAFPMASAAKAPVEVKVEMSPEDSAMMGGIYNINWQVTDNDRLASILGGHTLEVEFEPVWLLPTFTYTIPGEQNEQGEVTGGVYGRNIVIRDITDDVELARYPVYLFKDNMGSLFGAYTENAGIYIGHDTAGMGLPDNMTIDGRGGSFDSKLSFWAPNQQIYNSLALEFDHYIQQWGGVIGFHPDGPEVISADESNPANVLVAPEAAGVVGVEANMNTGFFQGFNNGPGVYEVEFLPGGIEENVEVVVTQQGGPTRTITVNVPYLNVRVLNQTEFERPSREEGPITVDYFAEMPHNEQQLPIRWDPNATQPSPFPLPQINPIGTYNLSSYGWVNSDGDDGFLTIRHQAANENTGAPIGQGRYYLTTLSSDKMDTVRFSHVIQINGANWAFDFAYKGNRKSGTNWINNSDKNWADRPTTDFKAGDVVVLRTKGGALGLPEPGFKFRTTISDPSSDIESVTDDVMEQVAVVPNPYYINHDGQKNRDRQRIYFTRLPAECTISIYTAFGDLIKTIEHDEATAGFEPGTRPLEVWNLLTENNQRVASQTLLAIIEAPNGAKTEVKFSVVQGGFKRVSQ